MIRQIYGIQALKKTAVLLTLSPSTPPVPPPDIVDGEAWAPQIYTYSGMIVYYVDVDGIAHSVRLLAPAPFNSSDLRAEYLAGMWRRMGGSMQMLKNEFIPADSVPVDIGTGPNGLILKGDIFRVGGLISTDGNDRELIGGASWIQATRDNPGLGSAFWKINNGLS